MESVESRLDPHLVAFRKNPVGGWIAAGSPKPFFTKSLCGQRTRRYPSKRVAAPAGAPRPSRQPSRASHARFLGRIQIASVRDRQSRAPALHDTLASQPFACPARHPDGCLRDAERVDALVEAQCRSPARHRPREAVDWRRATDLDVRAPSELARGRRCLGARVAAGREACRLRRTRTLGLAPPGPLGAEPASPLDRPELHRGWNRRRAHP